MKRYVSILIALSLIFCLAACGQADSSEASSPAEPTPWVQSSDLSPEENVIGLANYLGLTSHYSSEDHILAFVDTIDNGKNGTGFDHAEFHEGILFMYYVVKANATEEQLDKLGEALANTDISYAETINLLDKTTYKGSEEPNILISSVLTLTGISDSPCLATFGENGVVYRADF